MPRHEIPANRGKRDDDILVELKAEVGSDKPMRIVMDRGKVVTIDIDNVTSGQLTAAVNRARAANPTLF